MKIRAHKCKAKVKKVRKQIYSFSKDATVNAQDAKRSIVSAFNKVYSALRCVDAVAARIVSSKPIK